MLIRQQQYKINMYRTGQSTQYNASEGSIQHHTPQQAIAQQAQPMASRVFFYRSGRERVIPPRARTCLTSLGFKQHGGSVICSVLIVRLHLHLDRHVSQARSSIYAYASAVPVLRSNNKVSNHYVFSVVYLTRKTCKTLRLSPFFFPIASCCYRPSASEHVVPSMLLLPVQRPRGRGSQATGIRKRIRLAHVFISTTAQS